MRAKKEEERAVGVTGAHMRAKKSSYVEGDDADDEVGGRQMGAHWSIL